MKLIYMYLFVHFANVTYRKLHTMQYIRFHTNPTFQRLYRLSGLYVSTFITIACNYRPTYWLFLTLLYSLSCGTAYISALASHFYGIQYTKVKSSLIVFIFASDPPPPPPPFFLSSFLYLCLPLFLSLVCADTLPLWNIFISIHTCELIWLMLCNLYAIPTIDYKFNSVSVIANDKFKIIIIESHITLNLWGIFIGMLKKNLQCYHRTYIPFDSDV